MSDGLAFLLLLLAQVFVAGFGGRWRSHKGFWRAMYPALVLPALLFALILWMSFGMGEITDIGAVVIAGLIICFIALLLVGLVGTVVGMRSRA